MYSHRQSFFNRHKILLQLRMAILLCQLIQISLRYFHQSIFRNNINPIYPKSKSTKFILDHYLPKTQYNEPNSRDQLNPLLHKFQSNFAASGYLSTIIESNDGMRPGNGVRRGQPASRRRAASPWTQAWCQLP